MKTTPITTSCHSCGTRFEGVFHVLLCDGCLEARLAQLERAPDRPAGRSGGRGPARALALAGVLAVAAVMALGAVTPALAESLVFVKGGDVWLSQPDGSGLHRVTEGGDWSSPSIADDGTVVALRGAGRVVRVRQNGELLAQFDVQGSGASSGDFEGPYDPQVSPDGSRIAYWFLQRSTWYDPSCNGGTGCTRLDTRPKVTVTSSSSFTHPTEAGYASSIRAPSWIGNDRLLVSDYARVGTYAVGWDDYGYQNWYGNYQEAWAIHHQELTRQGDKLVVAHGDASEANQLLLYRPDGPAWAGAPPYDDYQAGAPHPNPPELRCGTTEPGSPSSGVAWSPGGDRLAIADDTGLYVWTVPNLDDCSQISSTKIVDGASQPDWSPAAAGPGPGPTRPACCAPPGPAAPRISGLRLTPKRFAARHGARLRFRLSTAASVGLVVKGHRAKKTITVRGQAGANRLRFRPGGLPRGSYHLTAVARDGAGHSSRALTRTSEVRRHFRSGRGLRMAFQSGS